MKKLFQSLLILAIVLAVCIILNPAKAQAASASDLTYELNSDGKSYCVTSCNQSASGALSIPAIYNSKPVTAIGDYAFSNCCNLTSVIMYDSVTTIGDNAFYYCTSLNKVTMGSKVTTIGYGAFADCGSLNSVTIPDSVTTIGDYAFYDCDSLGYIKIPNSVTVIGEMAFSGCDILKNVTIGTGVTTIGDNAFSNCTNLTNMTFGNSVTTIGAGAFSGCKALTKVTIPDSVTNIGSTAFYDCTGLTSLTIGNKVAAIGNSAFCYCTNLTSVTIPNSVTTIGNNAFSNCANLTNAAIGNRVATIGEWVFSGCKALLSVAIPDGVTTIGEGAFSGCEALPSVTLPDSVTTIDDYAFNNCYSLTNVSIGNSVTSIGNSAFYYCFKLPSVTIPESVTSIGNSAFRYCTGLTDVYYDGVQEQWDAIEIGTYNDSLLKANLHFADPCADGHTEEIIPGKAPTETETGLAEGKKCSVCGEILVAQNEIPALLTFTLDSKGQYYTLSKCATSVVGEVTIPATYKGIPVTTIGPSAFSGCTKVQAINIPVSVQKINYAAFYNCKALTELTIPEGVTDIQYSTFGGCTGLISVSLPDSIVRIAESAFDNCKSLVTINIPEGVTSIGRVAFYNCRSLDGITLPKTLTSLGESAFYDCKSLTAITIPGTLSNIENSVFYGCSKLEDVVIESGIKNIGEYAFYNCTAVKTVTIPNSVTNIGYYAFWNCISLTDVYYSGNLAQWNALGLGGSNAPLLDANMHFESCAQGHTYDHDFDADCNICGELRELNNTFKFENYRVVFDDPDTTHKNLRVEVYKLGNKTVADPTDEKALRAVDPKYTTHWSASNINKILITDAGNYVLLLKYNVGTGSPVKVPLVISVSADPKLIIDKNNKLTVIDNDGANINHRVVVYYLGDQTVADIYDEAVLQAIDPAAETVWQKTRINRLALIKGGNYVLHLCYNVGTGSKQTVAQTFTVGSIPTLSVDINNKIVVAEENAENKNHRAVVYFLGDTVVEDPYDEAAVKAAAVTTSKTYWGMKEINSIELKEGGNYVIHLYYNVGTSEKRTLALDVTLNERPVLRVGEDNRLVVTYADPEINNPRAYIYKVDDAEVADIYDEAALKKITTPTQVWGLSSINKKTLTPGTYVIHFYYSVGTSAKKTVALKVTI